VNKILEGAKPAERPIERRTKFELAFNLKAPRELGHEIPKAILLRADELLD
jgi:putative ABC transport system substrate-binding protein